LKNPERTIRWLNYLHGGLVLAMILGWGVFGPLVISPGTIYVNLLTWSFCRDIVINGYLKTRPMREYLLPPLLWWRWWQERGQP